MIKLMVTPLRTCTCIFFIVQAVALVVAFKKSDIDEYMVKNHRTRMRQNYVLQKSTDNEGTDSGDDIGVAYATDSFESDSNPEELPALIVDYANMIRNDIILLDNSVQTRTRKRGNVKDDRHNDLADIPCSCEEEGKKLLFLGDDYFPRILETRHCNDRMCPSPYVCQRRSHNITVLKKKKDINEISQEELPNEFRRWVAVKKPVTVGCMCTNNYNY